MTTFYVQHITDSYVYLDENDSRHAIKSLRLKVGNIIQLVDGLGKLMNAEIINDHPKRTKAKIISQKTRKSPVPLILALSPTKSNDRNEWLIEKAVEIGMTGFYPIICQNSERKKINLDRINKIAIAALKQSGRVWLPEIHNLINFDEFLNYNLAENKIIAHCRKTERSTIMGKTDAKKSQLVLIGPEGDFTEKEITMAISKGFKPIALGENRLRTETAGVVALTLMKLSKE